MKTVVVSQRVDVIPGRGERRDALDQRLGNWLLAAGYLPVPMPNLFGEALGQHGGQAGTLEHWLEAIGPAAVLLSGGNDIGNCLERDLSERDLMKWAALKGIPLLGICRGMQMMGVVGGAELVRVMGHAGTHHAVHGTIMRFEVNSYHDYALASCPDQYDILAQSDDGVIEAIRHRTRPWEGWMWHPEREMNHPEDLQRLHALFGE